MKTTQWIFLSCLICGALLCGSSPVLGGDARKAKPKAKLQIQQDTKTGKIVVSWSGEGVLKKAPTMAGPFKPMHHAAGRCVIEPTEPYAVFRLEGASPANSPSNIYTLNVVGYVNVQCPPGLSLVENPLRNGPTNDVIGRLWESAPDGLQVYKYGADATFEVSTFDGLSQTWSNPGLDISTGIGFYVRNPTADTITQTFVGEVLQGVLVNPLPEGFSTKGSLVPIAGSINTVQGIPGDPGDELSIYVNDLHGGGAYLLSTFSAEANAWVPDLVLNVGQGFCIRKQRAQNWVREFYVQ